LAGSALRGVLLQQVPVRSAVAGSASAGMRAGRAIMGLVVGGALDKTRGCIQMRMRGPGRDRIVPKLGRSTHTGSLSVRKGLCNLKETRTNLDRCCTVLL
jgi:hypothetical protein